MNPQHFVHGIDEAGYGPLLGPLVVGRADFAAQPGALRLPIRPNDHLQIGDSKQLLSRRDGFARLEAAVLGIHAAVFKSPPATLRDWLALDQNWPPSGERALLPWYRDLDLALPLAASADAVTRAWEEAESGRALRGGTVTGLSLRVTDETSLNSLWGTSGNKHDTLFTQVSELVEEVLGSSTSRRIYVDKLGGRSHYEPKLVGAFPFVPIFVVSESSHDGHYQVDHPQGGFDISFHVKGDDRFPAIGLASMIAKYTREALMKVFNDYWLERAPGIAATAGYYQDGSRFLEELEEMGAISKNDRDAMVRHR